MHQAPSKTLTLLLVSSVLIAYVLAKSSVDSSESLEEEAKQLRRSEISRALGLLKKHSVVGKNAKIVLKTSGKHLLVDPSERLQVVASHSSADQLKVAANSISKSKSSKLLSKGPKGTNKSATRKRASGGRTNKGKN